MHLQFMFSIVLADKKARTKAQLLALRLAPHESLSSVSHGGRAKGPTALMISSRWQWLVDKLDTERRGTRTAWTAPPLDGVIGPGRRAAN